MRPSLLKKGMSRAATCPRCNLPVRLSGHSMSTMGGSRQTQRLQEIEAKLVGLWLEAGLREPYSTILQNLLHSPDSPMDVMEDLLTKTQIASRQWRARYRAVALHIYPPDPHGERIYRVFMNVWNFASSETDGNPFEFIEVGFVVCLFYVKDNTP